MTLKYAFSSGTAGRHETFTPRYGWLKKGYDRCEANPHVFNDDNAIEQLGVGKNMVRSIRFWCVLFRMLEDAEKPGCLRPSVSEENCWIRKPDGTLTSKTPQVFRCSTDRYLGHHLWLYPGISPSRT